MIWTSDKFNFSKVGTAAAAEHTSAVESADVENCSEMKDFGVANTLLLPTIDQAK